MDTEFNARKKAEAEHWIAGGAVYLKYRREGDFWNSYAKIEKACKSYIRCDSNGFKIRVSYRDVVDFEWA